MLKILFLFFLLIKELCATDINFSHIINKYQVELETNKIIVAILDNKTDKLIYSYNNTFAEKYYFEPASVFKPIMMSIILNNNVVDDSEQIFLYNEGELDKEGNFPYSKYTIDNYIIKDGKKYKKNYFNYKEILQNNSSVGISQLAQRLNTTQFIEGFSNFSLNSSKLFKQINDNNQNLFKAVYSYGQGFELTFNELLNAYYVLNKDVHIKNLIKTKGFENKKIFNYSGTSQITENNRYIKQYVTSTFGFLETENNSYTIGISVIEPVAEGSKWYYYYSDFSTKPLFNEIVKELF